MPEVTLDSHCIYFEWQGDFSEGRETAIFLHDSLGAVDSWKELPQRLGAAPGLNALVCDPWGYGKSVPRAEFPFACLEAEVPQLVKLLDRCRLGSVHLVGHGDGGSIALLLAALFPDRCARWSPFRPTFFAAGNPGWNPRPG